MQNIKVKIGWKTAIKFGLFFSIGNFGFKVIDRIGLNILDSVMISLAKDGSEEAIRYCKKYRLKYTDIDERKYNPGVVGFKCYSEES